MLDKSCPHTQWNAQKTEMAKYLEELGYGS